RGEHRWHWQLDCCQRRTCVLRGHRRCGAGPRERDCCIRWCTDATVVRLAPIEPSIACRLWTAPLTFDRTKRQRVYVIGYPLGGQLSFSIHDSIWLDYEDPQLHYRTPTESGSSGSPVFDERDWKVVALHRAGGHGVSRLNGRKGTYQANVGVSIRAIRDALNAKNKIP
ncbi:MAG: trypsin-like peptidase domain-containing protein, partial [Myxococcales bacterium]|nr:trypsin-like peptidase domain-containing protein [Myxococcales bacterium]